MVTKVSSCSNSSAGAKVGNVPYKKHQVSIMSITVSKLPKNETQKLKQWILSECKRQRIVVFISRVVKQQHVQMNPHALFGGKFAAPYKCFTVQIQNFG